jgi:hypothetical protein
MVRMIHSADSKITILFDETEPVDPRTREGGNAQIRRILNAGIRSSITVPRCHGDDYDDIEEYRIFCPKALARIGQFDDVLASRMILVPMQRKARDKKTARVNSKTIKEELRADKEAIEKFARVRRAEIKGKFLRAVKLKELKDERLAELMLPLAIVVADSPPLHAKLLKYAGAREARETDEGPKDTGTKLLLDCRMLLKKNQVELKDKGTFVVGASLRAQLHKREAWYDYDRRGKISDQALGRLLSGMGIEPARTDNNTVRGRLVADFKKAFERYLSEEPSEPSEPSGSTKKHRKK